MSQHFFKDKAVERYDLQKSKLLTPFGCQAQIKNFKANLQPEYSCQRKTMLLANTGKYQTQIFEIFSYFPEIARYWIAVRCSHVDKSGTLRSAIAPQYLVINIT
jgi:hypothetical protein